jgi:probable HAF family extracellular repeat protein
MGDRKISILGSFLLSAALALPAAASAGRAPGHQPPPHYVLFDIGSFGGDFTIFCGLACRPLNEKGVLVGLNATAADDPFDPNCFFDCHLDHAFEWKNGGTTDLGALQYGLGSFALGVNGRGMVAGLSENGQFDPDTGLWEGRAVVWSKSGKIKDLGTLGGTQSVAGPGLNSSGEVAVQTSTADSDDPYIGVAQANCIWLPTTERDCKDLDFGINAIFLPVTTTMHGAVWSQGAGLQDTGTLGGPDSVVYDINDSGQAVGWSYVSYQAGSSGVPETHPFLWQAGKRPKDLGTFGGTFGEATLINSNGQVTGTANTAGDAEVHPFIWDKANGLVDLGGFGGDYGHGDWINDRGEVVGFSRTTPGSIAGHAFYWRDGTLTELVPIGDDPESEANMINNHGLIAGVDFYRDENGGGVDMRGWISDNGAPPVDVNTLIRQPHGLYVTAVVQINDRGVIAANAITRKGDGRTVVLVPEDDLEMLARFKALAHGAAREDDSGPVSAPSMSALKHACMGGRRVRSAACHRG